MKWQGHWWGIVLRAENEDDNIVLKSMLDKLDQEPEETYDYGDLEVDTENGLMKVDFNR
jgi:hypothetical protein